MCLDWKLDPPFTYYASKKLMTIRLPFRWERMQPTLGGSLDPTYLGYVKTILGYASANGMSVILDCHNFGAYNGILIGASGGPTQEDFATFWGDMASALQGTAGLGGYDLMNEPAGFTGSAWPDAAQAAISAIRVSDPTTPIYVEGNGYSSAFQWITNGNGTLNTLTDTSNKLVFEAHAYADYNSSGTYPTYPASAAVGCTSGQTTYECAETMGDQLTTPTSAINTSILVKRYTPFVAWCIQYSVKCDIGESGVPNDDPAWLETLDKGITYLQSNNVPFTYWAAGPDFVGYFLSVEPDDGVDTVQMAVLTKYTGAVQPTAYYLSGPQRGAAGDASGQFYMQYFGYITTPFTITPTDGGAGGMFNPASITCADGFNCSRHFTYTAPGTDVYVIGMTNSAQLTNPSSLGYATVQDEFSLAGLNGSTISNIFSFQKIYAPYIGDVVTLRRASDNATASFGFTSNELGAPLNTSAIASWAGSSNVYLVTWFDQSPNGNNAGPATIDTTPTNADQPQLLLNCQNALPCLVWNKNRMEMHSPVNGNTAQTVLSVFAPTLHMSLPFLNWLFLPKTQTETQAWNDDVYISTNMGSARGYSQDATWGALGATYSIDSSTNIGTLNAATNGTHVGQTVRTATPVNYPYRSNATLGWQLFTTSEYAGDLGELVILNAGLTDGQMYSFEADEDSRWNIPAMPSYSYYSPTLVRSTTAANAAPWRGVNEGEIGFSTPANGYLDALPVAAAQPYYASRGMNIVRFPVAWEPLQQNLCSGDETLNAAELSNLDSAVSNITSAGMDILIDLHNFGNYNYNYWATCAAPPDNGDISNPTTGSYFVNFWTQIAARYASNPKVKFDLMNEPFTITAAQMATVAQAAITAIRAQGAKQYIFVEGGGSYAACESFVSSGAGAAFLTLTDPQDALIAECHAYTDSNNEGNTDYAAQGHGLGSVTSATAFASANGIKLFLGETGVGFTPSSYAEEKAMFDYMAANPSVWIGWTAWGGGPAWPENYYFLFEPRATNYNPVVTPFIDRPMMRFLNTYATGHSWPAASGTWPNTVQFP